MGDAVSDIEITQLDDESVFAPSRRRLSAALVLTIVLVAFEGLAVSTIMPVAVLDLHGLALYAWSFSGFMLGSLVGTVASGDYADRSGPAYPFIGALVVFSCGLLACGTATSMLIFIAGRVIEGLGTGAVRSLVWLILRRTYPIGTQARMGAVLSSAWILPSLLGPTMAGLIARAWGWRAVFLALLALAPLALAMVLRPLRRIEAEPVP
jgi:MFS family permease